MGIAARSSQAALSMGLRRYGSMGSGESSWRVIACSAVMQGTNVTTPVVMGEPTIPSPENHFFETFPLDPWSIPLKTLMSESRVSDAKRADGVSHG